MVVVQADEPGEGDEWPEGRYPEAFGNTVGRLKGSTCEAVGSSNRSRVCLAMAWQLVACSNLPRFVSDSGMISRYDERNARFDGSEGT
jgi:hypothetical protein